jgi:uncharacterized protein DUF4252
MLNHRLSIAAVALLGICTGAHAQEGFFDFSKIPGLDATPAVQIDVNPAMLAFFGQAASATDPEAAALLAGIRGMRVFVYQDVANRDLAAMQRFIDDTSGKLESQGWHRAVFVQDDANKVRIYAKLGDAAAPSRLNGFTVMVTEESGGAVFINVDGQIEASQIGRLMGEYGQYGKFAGLGGIGIPRGNAPNDAATRD